MILQEEILDFIKRRFKDDCNWLNGNCYWFAKILCERFECLRIYYMPITGHFVAGIYGMYFDWQGVVKSDEIKILFDDIRDTDYALYSRLIRDCVM